MKVPVSCLFLALAACGGPPVEEDTTPEDCRPSSAELEPGERAIGILPSDVADAFDGDTQHAATWADTSTTTAVLETVVWSDSAVLVKDERCRSSMFIPTEVTITTFDGVFSEWILLASLEVDKSDDATSRTTLAETDLPGNFPHRTLLAGETRVGYVFTIDQEDGGGVFGSLTDEIEIEGTADPEQVSEVVLELEEGVPVPE